MGRQGGAKERWDYARERDMSLSATFDPGEGRPALYTLSELAERLTPGSVVSISDTHGQSQLLARCLAELGLVDSAGRRIRGEVELLHLGDLVDGRNWVGDRECLEMADLFDVVIAGNHEACLLGAGMFAGQPPRERLIELHEGLQSRARDGQIVAAHAAHGVLYSHAGVCDALIEGAAGNAPDTAAAFLNDLWEAFIHTGRPDGEALFAVGARRGGRAALGGALWCDWSELMIGAGDRYRQVVGHTPRGILISGQLVLSDTAGERLGVTVNCPDGRFLIGSDLVYRDRPVGDGGAPTPQDITAPDRPAG